MCRKSQEIYIHTRTSLGSFISYYPILIYFMYKFLFLIFVLYMMLPNSSSTESTHQPLAHHGLGKQEPPALHRNTGPSLQG